MNGQRRNATDTGEEEAKNTDGEANKKRKNK